eukprot:1145060-Ditylum_brightwellii.AAC.1
MEHSKNLTLQKSTILRNISLTYRVPQNFVFYAPFKYPIFFNTGTSAHLCPSVHAVPVATKNSAAHASNTKEATPKGITPKN